MIKMTSINLQGNIFSYIQVTIIQSQPKGVCTQIHLYNYHPIDKYSCYSTTIIIQK